MPAPLAAVVFDDYNTSGVPSSGNKKVKKSEARAWGAWLESIITAFTSNGGLIYSSLATLNADLAHAANSMAWVIGDATVANNGVYRKNGASGAGSWARVADLPYSFVRLNDVGAGTANAIQLTSSIPTSASVLRIANIFEANTGNVTISENGAAAKSLLTNSGNQISAGGLTAGMMIAYIDNGTSFRLLNDQVSAAIVAAAEAAAALAQSWADTADISRQWANKWSEQAEDSAVSSNLFLYSEQFDNAAWTKGNITATANATTAPDGTNSAYRLAENTNNSAHNLSSDLTSVAGVAYTVSYFVKANGRTRCRITFGGTNSQFAFSEATFDISAGALVGSSCDRADIQAWGNGWFRISATETAAASVTVTNNIHLRLENGSSTTYTGDGTSGIYIWGAQLEAAPFASSYVPTTTAAVSMYSAKHWAKKAQEAVGAQSSVSVLDFGAVADFVSYASPGTDNKAAFQACLDFCYANGFKMHIPAGRYYLSGAISKSSAADTGSYFEAYRPTIEGDGIRATELFFGAGNFNGISLTGGVTTALNPSWQKLSGFAINKQDRLGNGLNLTGHFHLHVEDVRPTGWGVGINCVDVHEAVFVNTTPMYNNGGMVLQRGTFTEPNIISLLNCTVGLNADYGVDILNPATFTMIGGSIEGNGIDGSATFKWGIRAIYTTASVEGTVGLNLNGVYLEANKGDADIWIVNSNFAHMVHNIIGCSFQKTSGTNFSNNCIRYDWSGTTYQNILNLIGNGFRSFNDYTPSASRPYVNLSSTNDNIEINDIGNFYEDAVEIPQFSQLRYGLLKDNQNNARGEILAAGTISVGKNVASCTKSTTGTYVIVFEKPMATANYHVSFTPFAGVFSIPCITNIATTGFTVEMRNAASALQDTRFSFLVSGSAL